MILTDDQLADITRVRCRKAQERYRRQREVLVAMGIEHIVRPDGSLVVSRAHVEMLLGGVATAKVEQDYTLNMETVNG